MKCQCECCKFSIDLSTLNCFGAWVILHWPSLCSLSASYNPTLLVQFLGTQLLIIMSSTCLSPSTFQFLSVSSSALRCSVFILPVNENTICIYGNRPCKRLPVSWIIALLLQTVLSSHHCNYCMVKTLPP